VQGGPFLSTLHPLPGVYVFACGGGGGGGGGVNEAIVQGRGD